MKVRLTAALLMGVLFSSPVISAQSDKAAIDTLMQGFPPSPENRVLRANAIDAPQNRWSLRHIRELQPTREIYRGSGPISEFQTKSHDLDDMTFALPDGRSVSLETWLDYSATHSFVILHKGDIIYERYFDGMKPHDQHNMFSVTKSFVGTLVLDLIDKGEISPERTIASYIPEMAGSAYADATVQQVLDMTVSVQFNETYEGSDDDFWRYGGIFGVGEAIADGASIYEFLPTLKKAQYAHGEGFKYVSPDTDVLGWLLNRTTGKHVSELISECFWQPMGVERDGYIWIDSVGGEFTAAGLNITARDAARFGQMILQGGEYNGQQILSADVAARILKPGDKDLFQKFNPDPWYSEIGHSYHDQWWSFNNAHKAVSGIGIHGQFIYIDPIAQMVVVKQSAHPAAEGDANEVDGPIIWQQIAEHLVNEAAKN